MSPEGVEDPRPSDMAIFSDFRSSSETVSPEALRARLEEAQRRLAALPEIEPLPPLPRADRIRLFAQSPYRLFLYWGLSRDPFETLPKVLGDRAAQYTLAVRLTDLIGGQQYVRPASPDGSEWFDVFPARLYRVELGLFAPGHPFIRLLVSNVVRTPRASVSPEADRSPPFNVSPSAFARILSESGYATEALVVQLEASNEVSWVEALSGFGGEGWRLLIAFAAGHDLDELRKIFPPELLAWFEERLTKLDRARLIEALRASLPPEYRESVLGASETFTPRGPVGLPTSAHDRTVE